MARSRGSILPTHNDDLGNRRPLGFLRGDPGRMMAVSPMADSALIPEKDWVEYDEWSEDIDVKDQDGKGACNGFSGALGSETLRWASGMKHVALSGWYIYSILCRGVDRGSMILDALELLQTDGCAPEDMVPYGLIQPDKLSTAAHAAAPGFKVEIGNRIQTYEQLATAIQRRQSINLAVCVGNQFNNLNSDGVPGLGRGYCNHAVHVGYGMKRGKNGEWLGKMCNSWSKAWGLNGFCWLPLKYIVTAAAFEAYTLIAGTDLAGDPTRPPLVLA
jgi:hypothetical protein